MGSDKFAVILAICFSSFIVHFGCQNTGPPGNTAGQLTQDGSSKSQLKSEKSTQDEKRFDAKRLRMVAEQLESRNISNPIVLAAMRKVPRHLFVPSQSVAVAYEDHPVSIGNQQTISQPYIVALMTELADPKPNSKALDIGTGSGYQAAVLAEICQSVHSIEIIEPLANDARERLKRLGYSNVEFRCGDGYQGWAEHAPFDVVIVAAAPEHVPQPLIDQLAPGGRMVIPVGKRSQELMLIQRSKDGTVQKRSIVPVMFVPMTGAAQK